MARRAKGEGCYYHIQPTSCTKCSKRNGCAKKDVPGSKCGKRDMKDRWCYIYTVHAGLTTCVAVFFAAIWKI